MQKPTVTIVLTSLFISLRWKKHMNAELSKLDKGRERCNMGVCMEWIYKRHQHRQRQGRYYGFISILLPRLPNCQANTVQMGLATRAF